MGFRLEPRLEVPRWVNLAVPAGSLVLALLAGGALFALLGVDPLEAYREMFRGALGSGYGVSEVVVKAIPLTLTGLAGALCYICSSGTSAWRGSSIWGPWRRWRRCGSASWTIPWSCSSS